MLIHPVLIRCSWYLYDWYIRNSSGLDKHWPPPSRSVGSFHSSTWLRHLLTPNGVMLKEHIGSPAMVSAPNCITRASGLNSAFTSCMTLSKTKMFNSFSYQLPFNLHNLVGELALKLALRKQEQTWWRPGGSDRLWFRPLEAR